jgi:hypothetical protein
MNEASMRKKCLSVGIILLFIASAFAPLCSAQIRAPQNNSVKTLKEPPANKVRQSNFDDDEDFFDFAIIWGTFEHKFWIPFVALTALNPGPWYNRTMHVIGYWIPEHQWFFKTSYQIEFGYLHIGIIGFHRLFVIAYGNIAAF